MAAPKENQFWKIRSEHGREFLFETPAVLQKEIDKYFNWVDAHPWFHVEAIKSGDSAGKLIKIPKARPYTMGGLCIFLNASHSWWRNFRSNPDLSEDFLAIINRTEEIIRTNKFEGAAVGAFNANLMSRDLGMAEKLDTRHVDKEGNDVTPPSVIQIVQQKADSDELEIKESEE